MAILPTALRPLRTETVHAQPMPDGSALLFNTADGSAHPISETAQAIWDLCDGERDMTRIVDAIVEKYDVDRPTAEADAQKLVGDLLSRGLLASGVEA